MAEFDRMRGRLEEANRLLLEGIPFSRNDSDATDKKVRYLTLVAEITHEFLLQRYGGQSGVRTPIDAAIAPAFQSFGGEEAYPDDFEKAAMLWLGITGGHTFVDGNKRTGFQVASYYLERAGYELPPILERDDIKAFGWKVADREIRDVETVSAKLRSLWEETQKEKSNQIN